MFSLFKPSPAHAAGLRLLETVTAIARQPTLFGPQRAPDTIAGRFEMMALFGGLAVLRLRQDAKAERVVQAFVDAFFKSLDAGLRESGVGDLTVPKKMKAIAGAVYGRIGAYEAALAAPDDAALAAALTRNLFDGAPSAFAAPLAAYARTVGEALAAAPVEGVESLDTWPLFDPAGQLKMR
jgi:cytochrome b pre-mRNA-processing protein 3